MILISAAFLCKKMNCHLDLRYYSDLQGNVQGPYAADRMKRWLEQGKLPSRVWVKPPVSSGMSHPNMLGGFVPLADLYPNGGHFTHARAGGFMW